MIRLKTNFWLLALGLGALTALASVLLVGVSAWFLASVALAGLGPAALVFNFHYPAALVRLLALTRTAGKYGERVVGHEAALDDQARHREALFRSMAASEKTRSRGWQLAQADQLEAFLSNVEADDFEPLRFSFPLTIMLICAVPLAVATTLVVPLALGLIIPMLCGLGIVNALAALNASACHDAERDLRDHAGRSLGLAHAGLVSLDASGERDVELTRIINRSRHAEVAAATARRDLAVASTVSSLLGPAAACATIAVAWSTGARAEGLLLPVLIGFSWLAFAELLAPVSKQAFAHLQAKAARQRLGAWTAHQSADQSVKTAVTPEKVILPLMSPDGVQLGPDCHLTLKPGEPTAILGPSGSGKTTALKCLGGWLPWVGGTSHPLGDEPSARALTHLSLHDAVVMRGTVRENLFTDAEDDAIWDALSVTELDERVRKAGGLDASIRQDVWSLGEARRLELTRALLSDKPLILLDEPGEHIRDDQARRILAGCLEHLSDRRVVFVTHQPLLASLAHHWEMVG